MNCTSEELSRYKQARWAEYWNDKAGHFNDSRLDKVLKEMKPPTDSGKVIPVACLWTAVHPDGQVEPWFNREVKQDGHFNGQNVWIFSTSAYLREYLTKTDGVPGANRITLELKNTMARLARLNELFPGLGVST